MLDLQTLEQDILAAIEESVSKADGTANKTEEIKANFASALAAAIDKFVRTATVTVDVPYVISADGAITSIGDGPLVGTASRESNSIT